MKKHSLTLLLQLLTSTIVMMTGAKTLSFEFEGNKGESAEARDLEMETNQERDVFPDLITFATNLYQ